MPIVAGVFEILAGFGGVTSAFYIFTLLYLEAPRQLETWELIAFGWQWLIPFIAGFSGIVSMVGGICALLCRRWGLAFAGAAATIPIIWLAPIAFGGFDVGNSGIIAAYYALSLLFPITLIVLIVLSKGEFK